MCYCCYSDDCDCTILDKIKAYVTSSHFSITRKRIANKYNVTESGLKAMLNEVLSDWEVEERFDK